MTDKLEPGYYWARYKNTRTGVIGDWEIIGISYWKPQDPPYVSVMDDETGGGRLENWVDLVGPLKPPEGDKND